jgi:hypothetical protein
VRENENGEMETYTRERLDWYNMTVKELKAFMAVKLYMGLKKLPQVRFYWKKSEPFLYCHVIVQLFSRNRYYMLCKFLHITNLVDICHDRSSPDYDKMNKVKWLFNEIQDCCIEQWNLGQFITIDEMMVRYKGSYCPARQYMPKKPEKWGMKIWCLADSITRYVYNFNVYCGASFQRIGDTKSKTGEAKQGQRVVESLVEGLDDLGHVVVVNNFFTSVELFSDLERRGIYATGTIRANCVGLPHIFKNLVAFKKKSVTQGTLE